MRLRSDLTMDIALATAAALPDLDPDERLLIPALAALGLRAGPAIWTDAAFDWSCVRACVIRSTWDYIHVRDRYLAWVDRAARMTSFFNPAPVVRWNSHKRYLADLEMRGVSVVPTAFVDRGARVDLAELARARGWKDIVVKPAVSGGSHATIRVRGDVDAGAQAHLDTIVPGGDALVQPYFASVEVRGEISVVFFDGETSHAIRKNPSLTPAGVKHGGEPRVDATDEERRFARAVLDAIPFDGDELLYARVDLARADDGAITLMELEVVEPSLFLAQGNAATRFAEAIAKRVR